MDFGNQRTCRIDDWKAPQVRVISHFLRDAMSTEDGYRVIRYLMQFLHEYSAFSLQIFDDSFVVNDLMAHINRRTVFFERKLDDLDGAVAQVMGGGGGGGGGGDTGGDGGGGDVVNDGPGQYELLGIISHMGNNTACGHYVCHIKKEGKWVLYNDMKVALSESPPLDLGYMYVYQRKDGEAMDVA